MENIHAIILAAGKGTRMNSDLPKCAIPFLDKPMVKYITDDCKELGIKDIVVVVGYKKEDIVKALDKENVKFAEQKELNGTGSAVKSAKSELSNLDGITLIFPGDMPLVGKDYIKDVIDTQINNHNDLTVVTTIYDDPKAYGRIYRENGLVKKIVEFKDCNEEQKLIKEVNSGLFCVKTDLLFKALDEVKNNNNQHEYYLTDIVEILGRNHNVDSYVVHDKVRLIGFNTMEELKQTEEMIRSKNLVEKYIK